MPDTELAKRIKNFKPDAPAPIIDAMITMLNVFMMTWLTPTMINGRALGTRMRQVSVLRVTPTIVPEATISVGTRSSPTIVARTIGGTA